MSIRHLLAAATPATAHVLAQPDPVSAYALTAGRLWSLVAALLGLARRGRRRARSGPLHRPHRHRKRAKGSRRGPGGGAGRRGRRGLVVAAADGGPGTGYGIVGGYLALAVGLIAMALAGLALARSRRAADRLTQRIRACGRHGGEQGDPEPSGEVVAAQPGTQQRLRAHAVAQRSDRRNPYRSSRRPMAGFRRKQVAARLVEVVSGQTFATYLRAHVFTPLGMNSSTTVERERDLPPAPAATCSSSARPSPCRSRPASATAPAVSSAPPATWPGG
ncbi:DUF6223 family protein [Streptosporangium lutulentum]